MTAATVGRQAKGPKGRRTKGATVASLDPASKTFQRLMRRHALQSLRSSLRALRRLGSTEDIRDASDALAVIVQRVQTALGAK